MTLIRLLLALVAAAGICSCWPKLAQSSPAQLPDCDQRQPCDKSACTSGVRLSCPAGLVLDRCGCCDTCALVEGQRCHLTAGGRHHSEWIGLCGQGLRCQQLRRQRHRRHDNLAQLTAAAEWEDADGSGDGGGVCVCTASPGGRVCGSDGRTYGTVCALRLAAYLLQMEGAAGLRLVRAGVCKNAPHLVSSEPASAVLAVRRGQAVTISCNFASNPPARTWWEFQRREDDEAGKLKAADGMELMPGDKSQTSVSIVGGPGEHEATTYLQIRNLSKRHLGVYSCMASNALGNKTHHIQLKASEDISSEL